jgi:hypothetical protein
MKIAESLQLFPDYQVDSLELAAALYLQDNTKLRFLCEFGFRNASDIAFAHMESQPYDYVWGLA